MSIQFIYYPDKSEQGGRSGQFWTGSDLNEKTPDLDTIVKKKSGPDPTRVKHLDPDPQPWF